jgi:hypothetical protein
MDFRRVLLYGGVAEGLVHVRGSHRKGLDGRQEATDLDYALLVVNCVPRHPSGLIS